MAEEQELAALFERRVAFHMTAGVGRPEAEQVATVEVYGGDVVSGPNDFRIAEAKRITGDA